MRPTPKDLMRGFIAGVLTVAFVGANCAFLYAYLILGKPLETVGTAALMSLINFAGIAVGWYLGGAKKQEPEPPV